MSQCAAPLRVLNGPKPLPSARRPRRPLLKGITTRLASWSRRGPRGLAMKRGRNRPSPFVARRSKRPTSKGAPARDRVVGPSGARTDAEEAQLRVAAAKRSAEQVAAGIYAYKRFTSAQSKERDGMVALGQSDYGKAIRLLVEAQSEYQAAVPEARREAERRGQLAPLDGQPRASARRGGSAATTSPRRDGRPPRERRLRPSAGQAGRGRRVGEPPGACRGRAGVSGRGRALWGGDAPGTGRACFLARRIGSLTRI